MKISRNTLAYGNTIDFNSVENAIQDALIPNAYSYDGQLEKLQQENEKLREVVSRLVECLFGATQYDRLKDEDKVEYILGYGYKVEP